MSKIGFKLSDIKKGGTHEALFYNQVVLQDRPRERKQGYILVEVDDDEINYNFLDAQKDSIVWENVSIFVEVPVSYKTTNVPTWLPNRTFIDEEGVEQIHTLESWGGVVRENLAGTKMIVKLTQFGDVVGSDFDSLVAFINGAGTRVGLSVQEARDLLATSAYNAPE